MATVGVNEVYMTTRLGNLPGSIPENLTRFKAVNSTQKKENLEFCDFNSVAKSNQISNYLLVVSDDYLMKDEDRKIKRLPSNNRNDALFFCGWNEEENQTSNKRVSSKQVKPLPPASGNCKKDNFMFVYYDDIREYMKQYSQINSSVKKNYRKNDQANLIPRHYLKKIPLKLETIKNEKMDQQTNKIDSERQNSSKYRDVLLESSKKLDKYFAESKKTKEHKLVTGRLSSLVPGGKHISFSGLSIIPPLSFSEILKHQPSYNCNELSNLQILNPKHLRKPKVS